MTVTRWWLEGEPGHPATLVVEYADGPECPLPAPERPATHPDGIGGPGPDRPWLSPLGVGVMGGHQDGAHGWIAFRSTQREDADVTKARVQARKKRKPPRQPTLL